MSILGFESLYSGINEWMYFVVIIHTLYMPGIYYYLFFRDVLNKLAVA